MKKLVMEREEEKQNGSRNGSEMRKKRKKGTRMRTAVWPRREEYSSLLKMGPIGCPETWVRNYHYSLRNNPEEHSSLLFCSGSLKSLRLRVFENRVLRKVFGPKVDKITVEWRKLHNEEFYDLYTSPSII